MHTPTSTIPVFVFGSNLAGRHGKGAALWARQHRGAIYGQGVGRQGNAYAIPTKDPQLRVLTLDVVRAYVTDFLDYARQRPDITFALTPIGCGLAGYRPDQIAPMFANAPANVVLPDAFSAVLDAGPAPELTEPQTMRHSLPIARSNAIASAGGVAQITRHQLHAACDAAMPFNLARPPHKDLPTGRQAASAP